MDRTPCLRARTELGLREPMVMHQNAGVPG